jgi:hypothetical protein
VNATVLFAGANRPTKIAAPAASPAVVEQPADEAPPASSATNVTADAEAREASGVQDDVATSAVTPTDTPTAEGSAVGVSTGGGAR